MKNNHSNQSEQKNVEKVMTFQNFYLSFLYKRIMISLA